MAFISHLRNGLPLVRHRVKNDGSDIVRAKNPDTSSSRSPTCRSCGVLTYAASAGAYRSITCRRSASRAASARRAAPASPVDAARSPSSAIVSCASIHVAWVLGKWSTGTPRA
jgi:hypothetical protein